MPPVWLRYTQKTVTPTISDDLDTKVKSARQALDAWVREIVSWHFDPATGCPFWLDYAKRLDWDPRREIRSYDDLDRFGFFQDEWLRGGPGAPLGAARLCRQAGLHLRNRRLDRCSQIAHQHRRFPHRLRSLQRHARRIEFFPRGADWLMVGPSGPRRLRLAVEHLAQHRGGICFMVDLDPRWVIKLIKMGEIRYGRALQAARHRAGPDAAARARQHPVPFYHAQIARSAVRKGISKKSRHKRCVLRRD